MRLSSGLQNLSGVSELFTFCVCQQQFDVFRRFFPLKGASQTDGPVVDTAEQVYISSLALLKMLKHGRAGVPMEVMGLMLGEFVDDYTVRVIDVFAMPQSGTVS